MLCSSRTETGMLYIGVVLLSVVLMASPVHAEKRVIILGFDGVDPDIVQTMMDNGELPNLKQLAAVGTFKPLASSNPPQSPTAWSSFSTCRTPLNHGIFDFLKRNPENYFPGVGFGRTKRPDLAPDGSLAQAPAYESNRKGETFWKVASDQGLKVKSLVVPFAYPNEDLGDGSCQLCGLDVQDIRGTQSTYFAFSEDFAKEESIAGGMRIPLRFDGNATTVNVPGIAIPNTRPAQYVKVPVSITIDRANKKAAIEIQDQAVTIEEGKWSEWLEWTFDLSPKYQVRAISRFVLMQAQEHTRLYMTCLQYHPRDPMVPISTPTKYAADLADRYGLYKTIGWSYDTKALQQDDMTEVMFLEDVQRTMAWREQLVLDEIDRGNFDLLVGAWTSTDRVSHMFWAYRDPKHPLYTKEMADKFGTVIEDTYKKMDQIVGRVMERLQPDDLLMLMSDHGFHSFRYGFSVNTWLARNGYLGIKNQADPKTAYTDKKYLLDFDWSRTKAYGLGLGMIFLNRAGRERDGIVTEAEAPALLSEMKEKLLSEVDPNTGENIFRNVYVYENPTGEAAADAPDIQLGYAEGYQTTKASAAGAAPQKMIEPNLNKWSGEHASSDTAFTSGIFFANKSIDKDPGLRDLGITALSYLGANVPDSFEGKNLF